MCTLQICWNHFCVCLSFGIFARLLLFHCLTLLHRSQLIQQNVAAHTHTLHWKFNPTQHGFPSVKQYHEKPIHEYLSMCSGSWCAFVVNFLQDGATSCLRHAHAELEEHFKKKTTSKWHLASESGTVACHNKPKKGSWQVNIKKVVALATSLQLITKTTLAWTLGAAPHQSHHLSPQRKFTQWAMQTLNKVKCPVIAKTPWFDLYFTKCRVWFDCSRPSWRMANTITCKYLENCTRWRRTSGTDWQLRGLHSTCTFLFCYDMSSMAKAAVSAPKQCSTMLQHPWNCSKIMIACNL